MFSLIGRFKTDLCVLIALWAFALPSFAQNCGDPLGPAYRGVTPYSNAPYMGTGTDCAPELSSYGYKWQCVEYVRRFHATNDGGNRWNLGNFWPAAGAAYKYFDRAGEMGLEAIPNGSSRRPQADDILVFDRATSIGDTFGHIAIVTAVSDAGVTIVEQNSNPSGYKYLPRDTGKSGYYLSNRGSYPIRGWMRKAATSPNSDITFVAKGKISLIADPRDLARVGLPSGVKVGDAVTFTLKFSALSTDMYPGDPNTGYYQASEVSIKIGSNSLISVPGFKAIAVVRNQSGRGGQYYVNSSNFPYTCDGCLSTYVSFDMLGAPSSYFLSDALPLNPPDIQVFSEYRYMAVAFGWVTRAGGTVFDTQVVSTIDSFVRQ